MGTLDGGQRSQTLQNVWTAPARKRAKARGRGLAVGFDGANGWSWLGPVLARLAISLVVLGLPLSMSALAASPAAASPTSASAVSPVVKHATRAIIATSDAARTGMTAPPSSAPFVPGEVLVTYKDGSTPDERHEALDSVETDAASKAEELTQATDLVDLDRGVTMAQALKELRDDPAVAAAEPNYLIEPLSTSNDPEFVGGNLWGMYGERSQPSNPFGTQAAEAWSQGYTGSRDTYVAVIDSGIDITHPDLAENIWTNMVEATGAPGVDDDGNGYVDDVHGWDFANDDATVFDDPVADSHGTHVAGTIGAVGGNGVGVAGVAWRTTIIPVKFINGANGTTADAVRAVDYVTRLRTQLGLNVVATNNSWGGHVYSRALRDAIRRGGDAGIAFVTAAGNDAVNSDATPTYPASYDCTTAYRSWDCVVAVASISREGALSTYSQYGRNSVDIAAPGEGIVSTVPGGGYEVKSGTSMAAPHVTGALALCSAANPGVPIFGLRQYLIDTARPDPALAAKVASSGTVNAASMAAACARSREDFAGAPESLFVTGTYTHSIRLDWLDKAAGEYGYEIQIADDSCGAGSPFRHAAYIGPGLTTWEVRDLQEASFYCFRVRAIRGVESSAWTEEKLGITWTSNMPFVSGRVVLSDGSPVANATVRWRNDVTRPVPGVTAYTDEDGFYRLQVTPGSGLLYVAAPASLGSRLNSWVGSTDLQPSQQLPIALRYGLRIAVAQDTVQDVLLPPMRQVTIRVVDASSGAPVPDANVGSPGVVDTECALDGRHTIHWDSFEAGSASRWCQFYPFDDGGLQTGADGTVRVTLFDDAFYQNTYTVVATHSQDVARIGQTTFRAVTGAAPVLYVPGTPSKPKRPTAVAGVNEIKVAWEEPWDLAGEVNYIDYYTVFMSNGPEGPFTRVPDGTCAQNIPEPGRSCGATNLDPGKSYYFAIVAHNDLGYGPQSVTSAVAPLSPLTVPGAPSGVVGVAGDQRVAVSWVAPVSDGGSAVSGYVVTASPGGRSCTTGGALTCEVTGLVNGTGYTFTVVASNAAGAGAGSDPSLVVAPRTVPGAPTGLAATAGDRSASVVFTAPAADGGALVGNYEYSTDNGANWTARVPAATSSPVAVGGLSNGVTYQVKLRAVNAAGAGAASDAVAVVPRGVPGAPSGLRVVAFPGARQAAVVWTAPTDTGGARLSGYRYRLSSPNSATLFTDWTNTTSTNRVLTSLANGASYRIQVAAVSPAGVSQVSTMVFRQATVASPVRGLRVVATPAAGRSAIAWNPPASNGGAPVLRYLVRTSGPNSTTYQSWVTSTATSRTLLNLRKGNIYRIQVIAVNTQGNSALVTLTFRQAR